MHLISPAISYCITPMPFPPSASIQFVHLRTRGGLSAVTRIGCETFGDLYNRRQALAIHHFYDQLRKCRSAHAGETDNTLLDAIQIALAFAIDRAVSQNTSLSRWDATRLTIKGAFSKQALAVVWDFAEANPFSAAHQIGMGQ
jgi:putative DNA methylase